MTWLDDLRGDWQNTPGVVTVTYTAPDGTQTAGVKAHRDPAGPTYREISGGAAGILATDAVWHIWAATLSGEPAQEGTIEESDGTTWSILSVQGLTESEPGRTLTIRWRCVCRKQV